jgi:hypothetical protein
MSKVLKRWRKVLEAGSGNLYHSVQAEDIANILQDNHLVCGYKGVVGILSLFSECKVRVVEDELLDGLEIPNTLPNGDELSTGHYNVLLDAHIRTIAGENIVISTNDAITMNNGIIRFNISVDETSLDIKVL